MIDDWGRVWEFVQRNDLNSKTIYMIKSIFSIRSLFQENCHDNLIYHNDGVAKSPDLDTDEEELKVEDLNISKNSEINLNQFDINNSLCSEKED